MTRSERNVLRLVVPPLLALGLVAVVTNPMDASDLSGPTNPVPAIVAPAAIP